MAAIIDIKAGYGGEEKLRKMVEMVKQKGMMDDAVFQCSITSYLKTIKKYAPDARIWYLRDTYDNTVITRKGRENKMINFDYDIKTIFVMLGFACNFRCKYSNRSCSGIA